MSKILLYRWTSKSALVLVLQNHTRVTAELQKSIPVYHSRSLKREFVALFGRCTGTKPAILRSIFRRLTDDQSASENLTTAEVDARVKENGGNRRWRFNLGLKVKNNG